MSLTHLSLFSGSGGLDLSAEWAGFETVGQCEYADYPTKVLEKHWPDVPRWRDIRTLTGESFYERTGLRTVDLVSGGFPCQPFSFAGKRRGENDDRYLWPEMLRVIRELQPSWVVGENVAGIVNMALDQVLTDLESLGYSCQAFIIPACGVDAFHRRNRVAIVANSNDRQRQQKDKEIQTRWDTACYGSSTVANAMRVGGSAGITDTPRGQERQTTEPINGGNIMENTACVRRFKQGILCEQPRGAKSISSSQDVSDTERVYVQRQRNRQRKVEPWRGSWWSTEPDVGRVAHGIPFRVDRLKCLGNAVVPQQFYPIFQAIADIEQEEI